MGNILKNWQGIKTGMNLSQKFLDKVKPETALKNRMNIVITKKEYDKYKNYVFEENENTYTYFCNSINSGIQLAEKTPNIDQLWVIGGSQIYEQCFRHHKLNKI